MQRYVLTERGKLLVATLILLILIIPSIILTVWTVRRDAASEPPPRTNPDLTQFLPPVDESMPVSPDSPLSGPIAFDIDSGHMTFLFSPEAQTTLDDNTITKIGELLSSPQNTSDKKITVDIPQLSDGDMAVLTAAIINAFSTYDVPMSHIIFFVYQPRPDINIFEVNVAFR